MSRILCFQVTLQLDLRWPLTLVCDIWSHKGSHIISINQVWFQLDFKNFSNETNLIFSASYNLIWNDLWPWYTWPFTSSTNEGSHVPSDSSLVEIHQSKTTNNNKTHFDRKIYHLTLREGYCARFDDRTHCGFLWPSQKKKQWHRSRFSNAL